MITPNHIFLDTSIFDGQQYNFASRHFKALLNAADTSNLTLLIPKPTEDEITRHISEYAKKAIKELRNACKKAPFLAKWEGWPFKKDENNSALQNGLIHSVSQEYEEFKQHFRVIPLGYDLVDLPQVMMWYNQIRAPFAEGEKRKEFLDMISTILVHNRILKVCASIAIMGCGTQPATPIVATESRPSATASKHATDAIHSRNAGKEPSCEEALVRYLKSFPPDVPPKVTVGMNNAVINHGSYLRNCRVPDTMEVQVCAAVHQGQLVGVDVSTIPLDRDISSCIAAQIHNLEFQSDRRLDVSKTKFAAVPSGTTTAPSTNVPTEPAIAPQEPMKTDHP